METNTQKEPRHVRIIKACALYVFPALIVMLVTIIFVVPAPKKAGPKTASQIDAEIQRLNQEKAKLQSH